MQKAEVFFNKTSETVYKLLKKTPKKRSGFSKMLRFALYKDKFPWEPTIQLHWPRINPVEGKRRRLKHS